MISPNSLATRDPYLFEQEQSEAIPMTVDHNPFYDGLTVFRLDVAQLRPGDIVLTRNRRDSSVKGRKQSSVIAAVGRSNFSHTLICMEPPTMIEAIGSGVSTLSISKCFYHTERDVRVLRYPDAVIAGKAAAQAGLYLGKGYSVPMAINSLFPGSAGPDTRTIKTFCSALVAAAFRASGAPEFQSINPYRTTPGDLTRMMFLTDVTTSVAGSLLAPRNIEKMTALDGERQPSPYDGQAKALFTLYAAVSEDITSFILKWTINVEMPTTFAEVLKFLVQALKWASQTDDPLKQYYLAELRLIDQKLAEAMDQGNIQSMNAIAEALDAEELARNVRESFEYNPDIDILAAVEMLKATAGQIKSRSWPLDLEHREEGLSLAWDRWCNLTASSIETLRRREITLREVLERISPNHSSN